MTAEKNVKAANEKELEIIKKLPVALKAWADKMTAQTEIANQILASSRSSAISAGVNLIPYLVSVYIEYLELRDIADKNYPEENVINLLGVFETLFRTGQPFSAAVLVNVHDPAYA